LKITLRVNLTRDDGTGPKNVSHWVHAGSLNNACSNEPISKCIHKFYMHMHTIGKNIKWWTYK